MIWVIAPTLRQGHEYAKAALTGERYAVFSVAKALEGHRLPEGGRVVLLITDRYPRESTVNTARQNTFKQGLLWSDVAKVVRW